MTLSDLDTTMDSESDGSTGSSVSIILVSVGEDNSWEIVTSNLKGDSAKNPIVID